MIRVTVTYLAQIRLVAKVTTETVELEVGSDLTALFRHLAAHHGPDFASLLLDEHRQPRNTLLVFVGDQHSPSTHTLQQGDMVSILSPMSGGEDLLDQ